MILANAQKPEKDQDHTLSHMYTLAKTQQGSDISSYKEIISKRYMYAELRLYLRLYSCLYLLDSLKNCLHVLSNIILIILLYRSLDNVYVPWILNHHKEGLALFETAFVKSLRIVKHYRRVCCNLSHARL
jgi:hypothetical protein